ncbi:MAG: hypothetical protein M0030_30355 [Actinomycetota bacterium]|nr:hypothetical protein [Actinomycetota bacterium]
MLKALYTLLGSQELSSDVALELRIVPGCGLHARGWGEGADDGLAVVA